MNKENRKYILIIIIMAIVIALEIVLLLFPNIIKKEEKIKFEKKEYNAKSNGKMMSEKEAYDFLIKRGFKEPKLEFSYDMDGNLIYYNDDDENDIEENSSNKHPMYNYYYFTEDEKEMWNIYIVEDQIYAYPVIYNNEKAKVDTIISETNSLTSYDGNLNHYFVEIPDKNEIKVLKVKRIDKKTLDNYSFK